MAGRAQGTPWLWQYRAQAMNIFRSASWRHQVAAAASKYSYVKAVGTMLFIALFFVGYFYVLRWPTGTPATLPATVLDRLIAFQPWALPLYLSLWAYVSLPPVLLETRRELLGYTIAMTAMCLTGLTIFYVWPTAVPPADIDWAAYPQLDFLKSVDASGNACPSLHVATAFFSASWLHHLLRRCDVPPWMLMLNWAWCVAIIYSAIATRQHLAVDVLGGLVLAGVVSGFSLRWMRGASGARRPARL